MWRMRFTRSRRSSGADRRLQIAGHPICASDARPEDRWWRTLSLECIEKHRKVLAIPIEIFP
jgi:hypothetical protein